jgi:hypothetical protein
MEAFFPPGTDLSKIPSRMPPPGVTPNFVDPPTISTLPRIFIYVTLPPMVIFVILRFYTRITITRKVGIDDCMFSGLSWTVGSDTDVGAGRSLCSRSG